MSGTEPKPQVVPSPREVDGLCNVVRRTCQQLDQLESTFEQLQIAVKDGNLISVGSLIECLSRQVHGGLCASREDLLDQVMRVELEVLR